MLFAHEKGGIGRNSLMLMLRPKSSGGQFGRLGVDWPLLLQVGGWIITGIGLGASVYDAIWGGAEKAGIKPGDLSSGDISTLASSIAAGDKKGRSAGEWETMLTAMLGPGAPPLPTGQVPPPGFYRDPASGAFVPIKKAGFFEDLGTGGMIALAVGGIVVAKVLKLI